MREPIKRARICRLLAAGERQSKVAKILKVSPSYVSGQTKKLLKEHALVIDSDEGREKFYKKGPNYHIYELLTFDGMGGGNRAPYRVHNLQASCQIFKHCPDLDLMKWDGKWTSSGTTFRELYLKQFGATIRVCNNKAVTIKLDEVLLTAHPDSIAKGHALINRKYYEVHRFLKQTLGFKDLGMPLECTTKHFAQEIEESGDVELGDLTEDGKRWLDKSKGPLEYETTEEEDVKLRETVHLEVPDLIKVVKAHVTLSKEVITGNAQVIGSNSDVLNALIAQNQDFVNYMKKQTEIAESQNKILKELKKLNEGYKPKNEDEHPPGYL